jgi:hypothetical protein
LTIAATITFRRRRRKGRTPARPVELGLVGGVEVVHRLLGRAFDATGLGADDLAVGHRAGRQLGQFAAADAVAAHELGTDAQLLHLAHHRAGHGVHATEEDDVRLLGLQAGQDGGEVRGLVVGELATYGLAAGSLDTLFELVGHALAIGRAVVDDGDALALEVLGCVRPRVPPRCTSSATTRNVVL